MMASLATLQHTHDPKAPLSGEDILSLLFEYCNNQIRENTKIEREYFKDLTNDKIEIVVKGFGDGIAAVAGNFNEHIREQNKIVDNLKLKVSDLEKQIKDFHVIEENLSEVNLKVETYGIYHQQSLYSLKLGLQDSLQRVQNDIKIIDSLVNSCNICGYTCPSQKSLRDHIQAHHCVPTPNTYSICHEAPLQQLYCGICGKTFESSADINLHTYREHWNTFGEVSNHTLSDHPTIHHYSRNNTEDSSADPASCHSCLSCGEVLPGDSAIPLHVDCHAVKTSTLQPSMLGCDQCTYISSSQTDLNSHMIHNHKHNQELHCNKCDKTFRSVVILNIHTKHCHESIPDPQTPIQASSCSNSYFAGDISDDMETHDDASIAGMNEVASIPQIDGNDSLTTDISDTVSLSNSSRHPVDDQPDSGLSHPSSDNIQFQYNLNSQTQTKKLLANSSKQAFTLRYNNPQIINGRQHPTNVTIDCNSGVYLSAVKPALQAIFRGWKTEILSTTIYCEEFSDRCDMSKRKVCTKLVLYLKENRPNEVESKVVLHFYHTSNTIQVQGSSLLSCGTVSPIWLVKHFLEPLANSHVAQNNDKIEAINNHLRMSSFHTCGLCNQKINSTATQPKDQELTCSRCQTLFHKRCTDRRRTTGNWRRTPWYCPGCVLGPQAVPQISDGASSSITNTTTYSNSCQALATDQVSTPLTPTLQPPPLAIPEQHSNALATSLLPPIPTHSPTPILVLPTQSEQHLVQPQPDQPLAQNPPSPNVLPPTQQPTQPQTTFPNYSVRQRSTNIRLENPELEFQKTALSACRSTIAQQEAELKRLKESLDIRNKRILLLESQLGVASETIAARGEVDPIDRAELNLRKQSKDLTT